MKKRNYLTIFLYLSLAFIAILGGLFLPELFLKEYSKQKADKLVEVPVESYASNNSSIATMVSSQLSNYERMRLISDSWDVETSSADAEYETTDAYDMVQTVKNNIQNLYRDGIYPFPFNSSRGDDWYSYDAKKYCCKDTTFATFATYYWVIKLTKYDRTETHTVLALEDGTILYVECARTAQDTERPRMPISDISYKYRNFIDVGTKQSSFIKVENDRKLPSYKGIDFCERKSSVALVAIGDDSLKTESDFVKSYQDQASSGNDSLEYYYIFQYGYYDVVDTHYAIGIIPYTEGK